MAEHMEENITVEKEIQLIEVTIVNGTPFIWKAEDVLRLRKQHRIVGNLIGCLPRVPHQNTFLGLPLELGKEEIRLLVEKKYARIVQRKNLKDQLSVEPERENKFIKLRSELYEEQKTLYKEEKRKKMTSMADAIFEGKKKRYIEKVSGSKGRQKKKKKGQEQVEEEASQDVVFPFDRDSSLQEELAKITEVSRESCAVQLFTESPWSTEKGQILSSVNFPVSDVDELRYQVFKDLWEKDLYVTSGAKFGGDFLAYPGDPLRFHAFYIVVCVAHGQTLGNLDVVTLGRLSTQVKKTLVLATLKPDATVDYISVKWAGQ